jgi:hypothetical protein
MKGRGLSWAAEAILTVSGIMIVATAAFVIISVMTIESR